MKPEKTHLVDFTRNAYVYCPNRYKINRVRSVAGFMWSQCRKSSAVLWPHSTRPVRSNSLVVYVTLIDNGLKRLLQLQTLCFKVAV